MVGARVLACISLPWNTEGEPVRERIATSVWTAVRIIVGACCQIRLQVMLPFGAILSHVFLHSRSSICLP